MNPIELRELELFVAVAEELSFAKAARRVHLSQPPLSRHIQNLERKLSVTLLLRTTRTVQLTAQGAIFLDDARLVLRQADRALAAVRQAREGQLERVNIGFVGALLDDGMIAFLRRFREQHPTCQVRLYDMQSPELITAVRDHVIDGAFLGTVPTKLPAGFHSVAWKRPSLRVVMGSTHPLASRQQLDLKDLADESWVMISRRIAPAFHQHVNNLCSQEGFRPRVTHESESQPVILAMVAVEDAISLVPETVSKHSYPGVVFRPLHHPEVMLNYAFVCRADSESAPLKELVKGLKRRSAAKAAEC
jgi:DNA-binding transcriptional LysR family regulator